MGRKNKEQIAILEQQLAEARREIGHLLSNRRVLEQQRTELRAEKERRQAADRRRAEQAEWEERAEARRKHLADLGIGLVSVEDADVSFHHDKDADRRSVTIELDLDDEQAKALRRFVDSRDATPAAKVTGAEILQNMFDAQAVRTIFGHRYSGGVVVG